MFIHWGPYSLASVEASWPIMRPEAHWNITEAEYVALYKRFNPVQFDPQAWVSLATDAGMRYMVFTTKHHDGFCMFDTALTDYKITKTPYGKDVTAMLARAAHDAQHAVGFLLLTARTCTIRAFAILPNPSRTPGTAIPPGRSGQPTSITWMPNCGNSSPNTGRWP